jgi:beta-glucuronidase
VNNLRSPEVERGLPGDVDAIETFRETGYVAGFTIWQYCDTRTDGRKFLKRPKVKNNKGIVDEYRRPKAAYHRVADLLQDG